MRRRGSPARDHSLRGGLIRVRKFTDALPDRCFDTVIPPQGGSLRCSRSYPAKSTRPTVSCRSDLPISSHLLRRRARMGSLPEADHRERDQFDGPDTFHLIGGEQAEIVAYARFLPTTGPHLLSPSLSRRSCRAPRRRGEPRIYEWTRQAIAPRKRKRPRRCLLGRGLGHRVCRRRPPAGLASSSSFTPSWSGRLLDTGWDVEPLALPTTYEGALLIPVCARVTARTLDAARAAFAA